MSIQPITTAFKHVSAGPQFATEFWVNQSGFTTTAAASTLALPGLYGQGTSILSCQLITPGTSLSSAIGTSVLSVNALNNLTGAGGSGTLYSALGTAVSDVGGSLGVPLAADSWLQLKVNAAPTGANMVTGKAIGLVVEYTTLGRTFAPVV